MTSALVDNDLKKELKHTEKRFPQIVAQVSNEQTTKTNSNSNYNCNTQHPDLKPSCIKLSYKVKKVEK